MSASKGTTVWAARPNVDLSLSMATPFCQCLGEHNLPDGEIHRRRKIP
jgi:hypothetical protein